MAEATRGPRLAQAAMRPVRKGIEILASGTCPFGRRSQADSRMPRLPLRATGIRMAGGAKVVSALGARSPAR